MTASHVGLLSDVAPIDNMQEHLNCLAAPQRWRSFCKLETCVRGWTNHLDPDNVWYPQSYILLLQRLY